MQANWKERPQKQGGLPNPALHLEEKLENPIKGNRMGERQIWTCSCCGGRTSNPWNEGQDSRQKNR